jgi:hypothetical protein
MARIVDTVAALGGVLIVDEIYHGSPMVSTP